jgi:hypothetical protein
MKGNNLREKPNQFLIKINNLKQVAASAENYSSKRLLLVFSNSEYRLKEIPGIDAKYHSILHEITKDCLKIMDTNIKESFDMYNSRLGELINNIIKEKEIVPAI